MSGIETPSTQIGAQSLMSGQCTHRRNAVGRCTVFNIHGHRYRLVARINYQHRTVYIRGIFTHEQYDRGDWKDGCENV